MNTAGLERRILDALEDKWRYCARDSGRVCLMSWCSKHQYSSHRDIVRWDARNGAGGMTYIHLRRVLQRMIQDGRVRVFPGTYLYGPMMLRVIDESPMTDLVWKSY